ncbi:MAG: hypothetical protein IT320_16835 [Anaerolineae bacterium]|nr:hypothetical protein [Anaerolineae bacterium]
MRLHLSVWLPPLALAAVLILLMTPIFTIETTEMWDHGWHINFAEQWYIYGQMPEVIPHFGYHLLLMTLKDIFRGLSFSQLAIGVMVASFVGTSFITYRYLLAEGWGMSNLRRWQAAGLSLALHMVAPMFLLTLFNKNIYFGYITPHTYHNPTSILLKPLALILFLIGVRGVTRAESPLWLMPLTFILSVTAVTVKPNYALCLLPAVTLIMLVRLARRQPIDGALVFLGLLAPAAITLGTQMTLLTAERGNLVFAPLEALTIHDEALLGIVIKLPLSLVFPLAVAAMTWRSSKHDPAFQIAWLGLGFGLVQFYLFNETKDVGGGNFWWGAQIALFILFIVSARIAWRASLSQDQRGWLWGILALHVVCGVIWWGQHMLEFQYGVGIMRLWW